MLIFCILKRVVSVSVPPLKLVDKWSCCCCRTNYVGWFCEDNSEFSHWWAEEKEIDLKIIGPFMPTGLQILPRFTKIKLKRIIDNKKDIK